MLDWGYGAWGRFLGVGIILSRGASRGGAASLSRGRRIVYLSRSWGAVSLGRRLRQRMGLGKRIGERMGNGRAVREVELEGDGDGFRAPSFDLFAFCFSGPGSGLLGL